MSKTHTTTPKQDGFRMPGEFEPHAGSWMLWPERSDNWRNGAKPAQRAYVEVAKAIAQSERVTMGVSRQQYANARHMLPEEIRVVELSSNDAWMRDCGPIFVVNDKGGVRGIDWQFNAWGGLDEGLYFPWDQDDFVPQRVMEIEWIDRYRGPQVLEGGSITVDGEGTLIVTEQCLLNKNRNPTLSREQIEKNLKQYLNLEKIIWLPRGCPNDETDGHIDDLCGFVRPGVVMLNWTEDEADPQHKISREALDVLCRERDAKGRKLEIHRIQKPQYLVVTQEESEGVDVVEDSFPRLPGLKIAASYINSYIANTVIVVPEFDDPADIAAQETLRRLFPERRIVTIPGHEILLGGGNAHCITQQQPLGREK